MHEISLVRSIFKTIESEFSSTDLENLNEITLKVGLLSNIEPTLMQNAFDAVTTAEDIYRKVKLSVELVPIEIECKNCGHTSVINNYKFICSHCNTPSNNVIKGTELLIHQLHFD